MSQTRDTLFQIIKKPLPEDYKRYVIPKKILDFFCEEKGLHPDQLIIKNTSGIKTIFECEDLNGCTDEILDLIKFYHQTPKLSVSALLSYGACAVRNFALWDESYNFHRWLLEHDLMMPDGLIHTSGWTYMARNEQNVKSLSNASGIEYLNRVILTFPKSERQNKLEELTNLKKSVYMDKWHILADCLVAGDPDISLNSQFLRFMEETVAKLYSSGNKSLLWLSAKKLSKMINEKQYEALPSDIQTIVVKAKPY
jgi:hypothetical protein